MNTHLPFESRWLALAASLTLVASLGACAGMSRQDQNTAIGAGVGAVGGAVLTDGSALGTLGGAAIGGVIGNQIETDDERNRRNRR
ncbi:osmotically-inducible lipoprotein OsmB [Hydrogenophaga aromaticivorans]|jgi:osmotically inducible lipoprotein OsmB|uniref:glycine zipper 2TM domain-containing protein n=1 Tax=Hydrogenophaga aromaticivorans TaxID=2610898 RepID=UPI001B3872C2|nr:glycine zipper 2TM domain-containing protein [Hydrogenophaga aromaticivorans]MBQ0922163.1 osmotically-inducible lipoprotein OsmB [Hydrogenophaga aromaticivorans]MDZ4290651.1 glycine zipper 2TM domain-containing protein [Hydrogenophaga sp.]